MVVSILALFDFSVVFSMIDHGIDQPRRLGIWGKVFQYSFGGDQYQLVIIAGVGEGSHKPLL